MREIILITGASSGIGYEMAKQLANEKYDLILVARRLENLELLKASLEERYGITVFPMRADLSDPQQAKKLYKDIVDKGLKVRILVNNAGFGEYGLFTDISLEKQLEMIQVNISSLVVLSRLFLADMKKEGRGTVMNVASLLSYLPFPYYAVYSATKSFVLAFTETVAAELEGTGVDVKTLCPGPVATEFNTQAMLNTNAYNSNKPIPAQDAAKIAVKHLLQGKGTKMVGFSNWFISKLPNFTPGGIMMKIKKKLASQRGNI
jgi:short-subunit dehydrogenase